MLDIVDKVRKHGAQLRQGVAPVLKSDGLVVSKALDPFLMRNKNIDQVDIVSPSWVIESIERNKRLPLHKQSVHFLSQP